MPLQPTPNSGCMHLLQITSTVKHQIGAFHAMQSHAAIHDSQKKRSTRKIKCVRASSIHHLFQQKIVIVNIAVFFRTYPKRLQSSHSNVCGAPFVSISPSHLITPTFALAMVVLFLSFTQTLAVRLFRFHFHRRSSSRQRQRLYYVRSSLYENV